MIRDQGLKTARPAFVNNGDAMNQDARQMIRRPGVKGRDIAGIVLGALILSILALVFRGSYEFLYVIRYHPEHALYLLPLGMLLFISICISIPTRYYEGRVSRAFGLAAFSLASAIAASGLITVVGCLIGIHYYNIQDEWWLIPIMIIALGLVLLSLFGSCAHVLAMKVQPRLWQAATGTAVGILLLGLYGLFVWIWQWR